MMKESKVRLDNVGVVLNQPQIQENIGAAARAAANMGVAELVLVRPCPFEERVVKAVATRTGEGLVDRIIVKDRLEDALADYQYVIGTTARRGSHRGPFHTPRGIAGKVLERSRDGRIALLFGPERTGLTNSDLRLCQALVRIPTADPRTSSLNLAQAVLVMCYELFLARNPEPVPPQVKAAPVSELLAMYRHLADTMVRIGFLPDENTDYWLMNFKKIFNRTGLTHGECNLIRGMCRQILWAVKTGGKAPHNGAAPPGSPDGTTRTD